MTGLKGQQTGVPAGRRQGGNCVISRESGFTWGGGDELGMRLSSFGRGTDSQVSSSPTRCCHHLASEALAVTPGSRQPAPPTRPILPFIYKLLEVLGEHTVGQLGRRLRDRPDGWGQRSRMVWESGKDTA